MPLSGESSTLSSASRRLASWTGFAITTDAYWRLLEESGLRHNLEKLAVLNPDDDKSLCLGPRRCPDAHSANAIGPRN